MKVIFTSHCQNDWYEPVGARKLKNSAKYFHPDIEMLIHGDNIIAEIKQKYGVHKFDNKPPKSINGIPFVRISLSNRAKLKRSLKKLVTAVNKRPL